MQLFHETFSDALREVVAACGGAKQVAAKLWPEKPPAAAHRLFLDCLNGGRDERLNPEQLAFVLRMGRNAGCHAGMNFLLRECGYADAQVMEPADEQMGLMREYIAQAKSMAAVAARIESMAALAATQARAA